MQDMLLVEHTYSDEKVLTIHKISTIVTLKTD